MSTPLISVITPTYNDGGDLHNAIKTVLEQEDPGINYNLEIIVVDDASTEQNLKETEKIASENNCIKLIKCDENGGPAVARNIGIKHSSGDIIAFIDADDLWPADKLKLLLPLLLENKNIEVAGGKVKYLEDEGREIGIDLWEDDEKRLTHVHLGALLVKRKLFDDNLYFDEAFRFSEDADWWLRIREEKKGIIIIEETTLLYRIHDSNMTKEATVQDLNLLKVLHKSLKRRKEKGIVPVIPQIRDFRKFREKPLISILVLAEGSNKTIGETIDSIIDQEYPNKEILLIDTGSDNKLVSITSNYPDLQIISGIKDIGSALNKGIIKSNGELVAFIKAGEVWHPEKLEKQWEILKNDAYCMWVTCDSNESDQIADLGTFIIRKHTLTDIKGFTTKTEGVYFTDLIEKLKKGNYPHYHLKEKLMY